MQNIVKTIENDNRLCVILRDTTSNLYSAHGYFRTTAGEFARHGTLTRTKSRDTVMQFADDWVAAGKIVLANRY